MLELFAPQAERAIGVDLSSAMLGVARGRLEETGTRNAQLRQGDHLRAADRAQLLRSRHHASGAALSRRSRPRLARGGARARAGRAPCLSSISPRIGKRRCATSTRIAGSAFRRARFRSCSRRPGSRRCCIAIWRRAPRRAPSSPCRCGWRATRASSPIPFRPRALRPPDAVQRAPSTRPLKANSRSPTSSFRQKRREMETQLWETIRRLAALKPHFVSVTYGAGGIDARAHASNRRAHRARDRHEARRASDLRVVVASKKSTRSFATIGTRACAISSPCAAIRRPGSARNSRRNPNGYAMSTDLVRGIRRIGDFEISVSTYPEGHPESASNEKDLDALEAKIDAGATRAITQFFFDNDIYFRFIDKARARGIKIPIVPGIMPIRNFRQVAGFATKAGASVPRWLAERFDGLDEDRRNARAHRRDDRRRTGDGARASRRQRIPFLHQQSRRSRLRDLPFAGRASHSPERSPMTFDKDHGPKILQALEGIARERILVLDGAMGTMIQRHKFEEADFRGRALQGPSPRTCAATMIS